MQAWIGFDVPDLTCFRMAVVFIGMRCDEVEVEGTVLYSRRGL